MVINRGNDILDGPEALIFLAGGLDGLGGETTPSDDCAAFDAPEALPVLAFFD